MYACASNGFRGSGSRVGVWSFANEGVYGPRGVKESCREGAAEAQGPRFFGFLTAMRIASRL